MKAFSKKPRGFSLIELLLVLGVLAILLVAAFVVYPQVRDKQIVNRELTSLRMMTVGIQNMYASRRDYTGLNFNVVVQAKLVPEHMRNSAGRAQGLNGAVIQFAPYGESDTTLVSGERRTRFRVFYPVLPAKYCVPLVQGVLEFSDSVYVGGSTISFDASHHISKEDGPDTVVSRCANTTTGTFGEVNSLYFFVR